VSSGGVNAATLRIIAKMRIAARLLVLPPDPCKTVTLV
jgi:hypothetical protein